MNEFFDAIQRQASEVFQGVFAKDDAHDLFVLGFDDFTVAFFPIDQVELYVRTRICDLSQLTGNENLFEEFLQGNLFYGGTQGAVLSINGSEGEEDLYLTERMPMAALEGADDMMEFCQKFLSTATYWRERCSLYLPPGTALLTDSIDEYSDKPADNGGHSQDGLGLDHFRGIRI